MELCSCVFFGVTKHNKTATVARFQIRCTVIITLSSAVLSIKYHFFCGGHGPRLFLASQLSSTRREHAIFRRPSVVDGFSTIATTAGPMTHWLTLQRQVFAPNHLFTTVAAAAVRLQLGVTYQKSSRLQWEGNVDGGVNFTVTLDIKRRYSNWNLIRKGIQYEQPR